MVCVWVKLLLLFKLFVIELKEKCFGELNWVLEFFNWDYQVDFFVDELEVVEIEVEISMVEVEIFDLIICWQKELDLVNQILKFCYDFGFSFEGDVLVEVEVEDMVLDGVEGVVVDIEVMKVCYGDIVVQLKEVQDGDLLVFFEVIEEVIGQVIFDWIGVLFGWMVENEVDFVFKFL